MNTSRSKSVSKLTAEHLLNILGCREKLCVVGYGLSEEARAPHFNDILTGVWSRPPGAIDPFSSASGYQTVINWFQWRAELIGKIHESNVFRNLAKFQETFNLSIVTQCVDGLASANGVHNIFEPYGNVFGKKCYQCGNTQAPLKPDQGGVGTLHPCNKCGGATFPDVTMFGWNPKSDCQQLVQALMQKSEVLIVVGTNPALLPFYDPDNQYPSSCIVLEVVQTGFVLRDHSSILNATVKEISENQGNANLGKINAPDCAGLDKNLCFLMRLIEARD